MNQLSQLIKTVSKLSKEEPTLLIGIDGFGGSGKSTLAKSLKENFNKAIIIQMDDFYLPSLKRADYQRVKEQVLNPLSQKAAADYQRYDWQRDALAEWHTIEPKGIIIVEGVYSIHPELAGKYNYKIWIECSQEVGFKRGIVRDKIRDNVDNTEKWLNLWMPQEKQYIETQNPKQYANYIIDGLK